MHNNTIVPLLLGIYCAGSVFSVSLHPSGELACSGGEDDKAHLWNVAGGTSLFTFHGALCTCTRDVKHTQDRCT